LSDAGQGFTSVLRLAAFVQIVRAPHAPFLGQCCLPAAPARMRRRRPDLEHLQRQAVTTVRAAAASRGAAGAHQKPTQ
jgi:hypothetical protein